MAQSSGIGLLKPVQHIHRIYTQLGHGIAAFKHKHGRQTCAGDVFADPQAIVASRQDIGPVIKVGLRAVAVVVVNVQYGVIQKAVAAEEVSPGVLAGRAPSATCCAAAMAQFAPARAASQAPEVSGVPASNENKPMRAEKLAGSTSVRKLRTGHSEGKASLAALAGSSATHSSQAWARKSK